MEFDTGSKDKGFCKILTLGQATEILRELKIPFIKAVQQRFKRVKRWGIEGHDLGIHIYFVDFYGQEWAYYTPIMQSLMIFASPRKVGIKQDLIDIKIPSV